MESSICFKSAALVFGGMVVIRGLQTLIALVIGERQMVPIWKESSGSYRVGKRNISGCVTVRKLIRT